MPAERNVAVLVDCENAQSAVLDQAMQHASTLGRVVLRRGYGNAASLTNKWQEALIRHGFAPCLQFQYVGGRTPPISRWRWTHWRCCSTGAPTSS